MGWDTEAARSGTTQIYLQEQTNVSQMGMSPLCSLDNDEDLSLRIVMSLQQRAATGAHRLRTTASG